MRINRWPEKKPDSYTGYINYAYGWNDAIEVCRDAHEAEVKKLHDNYTKTTLELDELREALEDLLDACGSGENYAERLDKAKQALAKHTEIKFGGYCPLCFRTHEGECKTKERP